MRLIHSDMEDDDLTAGLPTRLRAEIEAWHGARPWAGQATYRTRPARRLAGWYTGPRAWVAGFAVAGSLLAGGVAAAASSGGFTIPLTRIHVGGADTGDHPDAPASPASAPTIRPAPVVVARPAVRPSPSPGRGADSADSRDRTGAVHATPSPGHGSAADGHDGRGGHPGDGDGHPGVSPSGSPGDGGGHSGGGHGGRGGD